MATIGLPEAARRLGVSEPPMRHYIRKGVWTVASPNVLSRVKLVATKGPDLNDPWEIDEKEVENYNRVLSKCWTPHRKP